MTAVTVGDMLGGAEIPNAVIDLDWLRRSWPSPEGDRFNSAMALRNLRPTARNYLEAGAVRLVLAGVIETRAERDSYQDALGVPLSVCRLRVALPKIQARLVRRHAGDRIALRWHLDRSTELHGILEDAEVEDFAVEASTESLWQVAAGVIRAVGWDRPRA